MGGRYEKGFVIIRDVLYGYYGDDAVVFVPENVTAISGGAFADCEQLIEIYIPDSVCYIGENAFSGCFNLTILASADSSTKEYAEENWINFDYIKREV